MSLSDVIREVAIRNPELSREVLTESLTDQIELILEDVFRKIQLPTISPWELRKREYLVTRKRKKARDNSGQLSREQELLSREISGLKQQLDGSSSPSIYTEPYSTLENDPLSSIIRDGMHESSPGSLVLGRNPLMAVSDALSPELGPIIHSKDLAIPKFNFDSTIQERISSDPAFEKFFKAIESSVGNYVSKQNFDWDFDAIVSRDVEDPAWESIVLRIKPPQVQFDRAMQLWDNIDAEARNAIDSIAHVYPEYRSKILEMNKHFFIEMNLS